MGPSRGVCPQENGSHQRFLEHSCMNNPIYTQINAETVQGFSAPQAKMNFPDLRLWRRGLSEAGGEQGKGPCWSRNRALCWEEASLLLLQLRMLGRLKLGGLPCSPAQPFSPYAWLFPSWRQPAFDIGLKHSGATSIFHPHSSPLCWACFAHTSKLALNIHRGPGVQWIILQSTFKTKFLESL